MKNYTLGLDIGVASVGWAAINQEEGKLIEYGVRLFNSAEEAKSARINRLARRTLRRKKWRKQELLKAFDAFGIVTLKKDTDKHNKIIGIDEYELKEYLNFNSKYKDLKVPNVDTVYHLRQKALKEKVSTRELVLCLYNILQARGHFLMENIDFTREGVSFEKFKEEAFELIETYKIGEIKNTKEFEDRVLVNIYTNKYKADDIKNEFKNNVYADDEEDQLRLLSLCKLLRGYKADINGLISKDIDEKKSVNIDDIKKEEERSDFEEALVTLYDIIQIAQNLSDGCKYVCDVDVKHYEEFKKIVSDKKLNKEEKKSELINFINKSKSTNKEKADKENTRNWYGRSIKNLDHSYPNGMYVNEAVAILKCQSEYNTKITPEFIEVVSSIVSAKIPYYIGPLGKNAKNGWSYNNNIKYQYSYEYSKDSANEFESIKKWKERMISRCTYLPNEYALPKGSLIGELYSVLNELNNYQAIDMDKNDYYLTREDKIKVLNELFLQKKDVTFKDILECLKLSSFGNKKQTMSKFNNSISLYINISKIIPELKLGSIEELFTNNAKIEEIEDIILNINLFNEEKSKYIYFNTLKKYTDEQCKSLSKLKSNNFYRVSYKFIMKEPMDINNSSVMEILLNDNNSTQKNNLMVIIQNACDSKGEPKDYSANKYEKIIKDNNNKLTFDLIMQNGKALMPISRPVVRSLYETLKIYKSIIDVYGIPNRVIIENASGKDGISDFTENSGSPMKRFKANKTLYDYVGKQVKEYKNTATMSGQLDKWEDLEKHFKINDIKLELYIRQNGLDLLTGKKIDITNLKDYEVDHILPRGFGDDSMDDKMLTHKLANSKKGDRLPVEFLESTEAKTFTTMTIAHYEDIVNSLYSMKLISDKKKDRLLLKNQDEFEEFINQNLVDTRYIIREFRSILNAFNKVNNYDSSIVNLRGAFTSVFRKQFGFRKNRELGDQHHAYDAATICITDKVLSQYYPNYDKHGGMKSYTNFIKLLDENNKQDGNSASNDRIKTIINYAFYKAYNQEIKKSTLIKQLKETTPLASYKVERNYQGKLFDATLYKPQKNQKSVLNIIGVNNDKRDFSYTNCVAVDFYKIGGKHYGVHIPYAIVRQDGSIDENKYKALIKEHYKINNLIDENNILQTKAFRFRAFKNDLIYDTSSNEPLLFNIGSVAKKQLEINLMNVFAYKEIDGELCQSLINEITKKFHLKTKQNSDGVIFSELDKKEVINYLCDELNIISNKDRHINALIENTKNINNIREFCMMLSYLSILSEKPYNIPKIIGQNTPVVNNGEITKNKDAEWVKIKYHPLGVRFAKDKNDKLMIVGPCGKENAFNKIKREDFSWKISKL